jgi:Zn-dependent peptidase ImmA (M78 family)
MHNVSTDMPEQEADRFASEFLMPRSSVIGDIQHLTFNDLAKLKIHWKVSMQAIIMRAKNLETITPWQSRALFERISRLGYRTNEPIDLPIEEPTILRDLIDIHITEFGYSIDDLAKLMFIAPDELGDLYGLSGNPRLRLVTV